MGWNSRFLMAVVAAVVLGLAGTIGIPPAARAAPYPNPACDRERAETLDQIYRELNDLEDLTPQVPPEEVTYLEKEFGASMKVGDRSRVSVLVQRKYFDAWQVHTRIKDAKARLDTLRNLPKNKWPKMHIQLAANAQFSLADVRDAWTEYAHSDLSNGLSLKDHGRASAEATEISGLLGGYTFCWGEMLPDDK